MNRLMSVLARGAALAGLSFFAPAGFGASQLLVDGFDASQPLTNNWVVAQQSDAYVAVADYSSLNLNALFGVGSGAPVSIPEATLTGLVGGPATTGVVFAANADNGAAAAVNLISNLSFAAAGQTLQFDLWMSTGLAALDAQTSTELATFALGRTTTAAVGYSNRNSAGNGLWGWLAGDNGIGSEDAALFNNTTELIDVGDTFDPGAGAIFDAAFGFDFVQFAHDSPLAEWVTVRLQHDGANLRVSFNGHEFLSAPAPAPSGRIAIGYADPFASISSSPDFQFGVIDNVILIGVPEPGGALLAIVAAGWLVARRPRRAPAA